MTNKISRSEAFIRRLLAEKELKSKEKPIHIPASLLKKDIEELELLEKLLKKLAKSKTPSFSTKAIQLKKDRGQIKYQIQSNELESKEIHRLLQLLNNHSMFDALEGLFWSHQINPYIELFINIERQLT